MEGDHYVYICNDEQSNKVMGKREKLQVQTDYNDESVCTWGVGDTNMQSQAEMIVMTVVDLFIHIWIDLLISNQ